MAELKEMVQKLKSHGMACNCDLDNWAPEASTGHSEVCQIHTTVMTAQYRPSDLGSSLAVVLGLEGVAA